MTENSWSTKRWFESKNADDQPFDMWALAIGLLIVAVAVSSLIDDAGLLSLPWWLVFVIATLAGSCAVAFKTLKRL